MWVNAFKLWGGEVVNADVYQINLDKVTSLYISLAKTKEDIRNVYAICAPIPWDKTFVLDYKDTEKEAREKLNFILSKLDYQEF